MASQESKSDDSLQKDSTAVATELKGRLADSPLTIVVFGASGHLARTKTYVALYELFECDVFTEDTLQIIGYARSGLSNEEFRKRISEKLKGDRVEKFLSHCTYFQGKGYGDDESFKAFGKHIDEKEAELIKLCDANKRSSCVGNRLFYLATPPGVFIGIAELITKYLSSNMPDGFNRTIVEKPFGKDSQSCEELISNMAKHLQEDQVYRIDHYLAKEMVQNILVLRFSNTIWDTIWDRRSIRCVKISMKESAGVAGRGGYYDEYGVIRDVFQNHLLQVLTLVAMEAPVSLADNDVRDEKVKVLKAIQTPVMDRVVVGQYDGYKNDESVKKMNPESNQLTFAQMVLYVNNKRWAGVPFICKCGKGLDDRNTQVRIQFKNDGICLYPGAPSNELVIRIQPNEAIWMKMNTKKPGFARFDQAYENVLDLTYQQRFEKLKLPGAYTRLILDALAGDHSLFVRDDELREAWRIVTPVLQEVGKKAFKPVIYKMGGRGPEEADRMALNYGFNLPAPFEWKQGKMSKSQKAPADDKSASFTAPDDKKPAGYPYN